MLYQLSNQSADRLRVNTSTAPIIRWKFFPPGNSHTRKLTHLNYEAYASADVEMSIGHVSGKLFRFRHARD
jgi:hypothetical protein